MQHRWIKQAVGEKEEEEVKEEDIVVRNPRKLLINARPVEAQRKALGAHRGREASASE